MQPRHNVPKHHQDRTWAIYGKSVPQLFLERAAARPDAVALRYKDFGLYQEVAWHQYRDDVEAFARGLIALNALFSCHMWSLHTRALRAITLDINEFFEMQSNLLLNGLLRQASPAPKKQKARAPGARLKVVAG